MARRARASFHLCVFAPQASLLPRLHVLTRLTDQSHGNRLGLADLHRRMSTTSQTKPMSILPFTSFAAESQRAAFGYAAPDPAAAELPLFIKPLPSKIGPDEVAYLEKKGALTIPSGTLRSEMLRAYIEFVHPYMPLLELRDFLVTIDQADGSLGKVSLILFQAVMFAGSAFIDMSYLRAAGYATRKEARKDFFQKTRVSDISVSRSLVLLGSAERFSDPASCKPCFCTTVRSAPHVNGARIFIVRYENDADELYRFFTILTTNLIASRWFKPYSC